MIVEVNYETPTGCDSSDFTLITNTNFSESEPVQTQAYFVRILGESAPDTICTQAFRSWTKTITIDLTELKKEYQGQYKTQNGEIQLNVKIVNASANIGSIMLYSYEEVGEAKTVFDVLYAFDR